MTTASTTKATRHPVAAELNRARLVEGLVNATKRSSRYLPYQVALTGPKRGEIAGQCGSAFCIGHPLTCVARRLAFEVPAPLRAATVELALEHACPCLLYTSPSP